MRKEPFYSIMYFILTIIYLTANIFTVNDFRQREETARPATSVIGPALVCISTKKIEILPKNSPKITVSANNSLKKINKTASFKTEYIRKNECELPSVPTHVKFFTDYRYYSLWYTPHYRLQQSAWTDEQGLRRYNEDYIVALGSFYSTDIGDRFEITLDTGKTFTVILGDGKVDEDCDSRNMYTPCIDYGGNAAANLLEFVIDETVLDSEVYSYGSLDYLEQFKGNIVEMVYLGRDKSQDWDTYEISE